MNEETAFIKKSEIEPTLQFSVLCERYVQTPSGKPNFEEVFAILLCPSTLRFTFVNRYVNGLGEFNQKIRIYKPDIQISWESPELKIKLGDRAHIYDAVATVQRNFEVSGVWWIEILLNNKPIMCYPLPVYDGK